MLFENNQINTDQLPKAENIEYLPLQKIYILYQIIQWTITIIILTGIASFFMFQSEGLFIKQTLLIYLAIAVLYIFRIIIFIIGFPLKGYALREHDIVFRTGILVRNITSIPFNRIQHSEVRQSFLARLLKITKIKIFTAGGNASDLSIHGLTPDEASKIKDFLSKTVSQHE